MDKLRSMIKYIKENSDNKSLVGVEIGLRHGLNSISIMENLNIKTLYSVDPYISYTDSDKITYNRKFKFMNKTLKSAKKNLRSYIDSGMCVFILKNSLDASGIVCDDLDFVYIDGCHLYDFVLQDCECWYSKVKVGGVFGGHDYAIDHQEVMDAVDMFCDTYNLTLHIGFRDWWIVKK